MVLLGSSGAFAGLLVPWLFFARLEMEIQVIRSDVAGDRPPSTLDHALMTRIESIDLTMPKLKLMDPEEGQGWSKETADLMELRYKRFLYLVVTGPKGSIVPTKDIDVMWHQHILDTRAYGTDCERVFGRFLHHFPYFGLRGEQDRRDLENAFKATCEIYERTFGEPYMLTVHSASCDGSGTVDGRAPNCGDSPSCGTGACAKCGESYCSSIKTS